MKTLKDFNVTGKKVLVRCDFNVPLDEEGNILDSFRIEKTIPTIRYLIEKGAKVILMSHLGSPGGKVVEELRLDVVQKKLMDLLGVVVEKTPDCIGKEVENIVSKLEKGDILLLENLRFHEEEKKDDLYFARELADLADIYINDAFGVSHRKHASVIGVPKYLPSGAGLLLEKEIEVLSKVLKDPERPLIAIIGGSKIESKTMVIRGFLEAADHLLIGGEIANTILTIKGICVGRPWPEESVVKEVEKLDLTSSVLHLPIDVIASPDLEGKVYIRDAAPAKIRKDELILDIGPETIELFSRMIKEAKTIVWAGPVGLFENRYFEKGTREIAKAIAENKEAYKIIGGGETLFATLKFGVRDKIDHVSTGGGAMLSFLGGEELPGLKAIDKNARD